MGASVKSLTGICFILLAWSIKLVLGLVVVVLVVSVQMRNPECTVRVSETCPCLQGGAISSIETRANCWQQCTPAKFWIREFGKFLNLLLFDKHTLYKFLFRYPCLRFRCYPGGQLAGGAAGLAMDLSQRIQNYLGVVIYLNGLAP